MPGEPKFFWSPPDGAPIVGVTTFHGHAVIATASGVYVIQSGDFPVDNWTVHKISAAVRGGDAG